jgi:hypothetical protein
MTVSTQISYDGRVFHPVDPRRPVPRARSARSDDSITTGYYHQDGDLVWAEFRGPKVKVGRLVGATRPDGVIDAAYSQVMTDGTVVAGRCVSSPSILPDGRIRLTEKWHRIDGSAGTSYIEEEL